MARGMGGHSPSNIAHFLKNMDFPAKKDDLVKHAKGNDADKDVLDVLQQMPQREYGNMADVMKGLGETK
ncbi:DUF2795 domain-containing protein [Telmatospirillum sp. J64-1]|uniref:DUF2795 domain-containing protein n=1 Tax=Telmatospirillum sp. J64-1 TaxID=2502183 RepID=UPI00163D467B|nr:DUF2795 domain-containing protein [Telmatospirillum sp. J64-1]